MLEWLEELSDRFKELIEPWQRHTYRVPYALHNFNLKSLHRNYGEVVAEARYDLAPHHKGWSELDADDPRRLTEWQKAQAEADDFITETWRFTAEQVTANKIDDDKKQRYTRQKLILAFGAAAAVWGLPAGIVAGVSVLAVLEAYRRCARQVAEADDARRQLLERQFTLDPDNGFKTLNDHAEGDKDVFYTSAAAVWHFVKHTGRWLEKSYPHPPTPG
ncbi:MAG TPA: hypothetical protein VHB73_06925 [Alphaproteobacteria bacterium]|nr:hypothetical protein [Alphaproteobacteria bacterium]